MPLYTTLASLQQVAASNAADGSVDAPSTIDQQTNLLASFIAQLRDGNGFAVGISRLGQCRLTKSGANLVLSPYNGNGLTINGVVQTIPSAGVSLAPTGATPSTLYYIYAYMVSTTMTLEYSTTGHSTDTATGVEIKTGDATRTLVGMARPVTGPAWIDTTTQRFVVSWFNRRPLAAIIPLTGNIATVSSTYVEVDVTFRLSILSWAGDGITFGMSGNVTNTSISTVSSALFTNGTAGTAVSDAFTNATIPTGNYFAPANCSSVILGAADGFTYIGMQGSAGTAGTATWVGNAAPAFRCSIFATIQG